MNSSCMLRATVCTFVSMACEEELEWYKSVKETQASVEVTSFGQMNNIFQYGCYTVGSSKSKICQNYHEVIHLSLKERRKRLTKKNYNLEELRDLESKLVLITGSKAENRASVDTFIDVSACMYHAVVHRHACTYQHNMRMHDNYS